MTSFFHLLDLAVTVLWYSFLYLKILKIHFHGVPFWSILVYKILEFWRRKLWDENFVLFDSGKIHITESKSQVLLYLSSWELNLSDLMVYDNLQEFMFCTSSVSCLFCRSVIVFFDKIFELLFRILLVHWKYVWFFMIKIHLFWLWF